MEEIPDEYSAELANTLRDLADEIEEYAVLGEIQRESDMVVNQQVAVQKQISMVADIQTPNFTAEVEVITEE